MGNELPKQVAQKISGVSDLGRSLERIHEIEAELDQCIGAFQGHTRARLNEERKQLLVRVRSEARILRARIDEVRQTMAISLHRSGVLGWFRQDHGGDTLLEAECQELEELLQRVMVTVHDLDDAEDAPINEVEKPMTTLEAVKEGSALWNVIVKLVNERSEEHVDHYHYSMAVKHIWRVPGCPEFTQMEDIAKSLGRPTPLFHGTSAENVTKIVKTGFQLPRFAGMFGKGIYFAFTPLKSVQYAKKKENGTWWSWLFRNHNKRNCKSQMLLCDVYLGRTLLVRRACREFDPDAGLKGGMFSNAFGLGNYNSVHALGGLFGAVNVAEYVVYEPYQAIPKYVIEFERA